ncbi:hypothetical protein T484DRAFT_3628411 [Baffinella frigidus]|nr:hypothetical protein T484DRAFT_3628411 [Cryptophyta sp. CCMP2293]
MLLSLLSPVAKMWQVTLWAPRLWFPVDAFTAGFFLSAVRDSGYAQMVLGSALAATALRSALGVYAYTDGPDAVMLVLCCYAILLLIFSPRDRVTSRDRVTYASEWPQPKPPGITAGESEDDEQREEALPLSSTALPLHAGASVGSAQGVAVQRVLWGGDLPLESGVHWRHGPWACQRALGRARGEAGERAALLSVPGARHSACRLHESHRPLDHPSSSRGLLHDWRGMGGARVGLSRVSDQGLADRECLGSERRGYLDFRGCAGLGLGHVPGCSGLGSALLDSRGSLVGVGLCRASRGGREGLGVGEEVGCGVRLGCRCSRMFGACWLVACAGGMGW